MKKLRLIATPVVAAAGVLLAADQDTYPHWVRGAIVGVLLVGASLGIPAIQPITQKTADQ